MQPPLAHELMNRQQQEDDSSSSH